LRSTDYFPDISRAPLIFPLQPPPGRGSVVVQVDAPETFQELRMATDLVQELAVLRRLSISELRARFTQLFGETTRTGNKIWLIKRIAWRLQALEEGDLSERARRRAAELACDADLRLSAPHPIRQQRIVRLTPMAESQDPRLPMTGSVLTRTYKSESYHVKVLAKGFEFENQIYKSLSAVAKVITGTHCNGFLFFGLTQSGGGQ
jgi:hypothetical protein